MQRRTDKVSPSNSYHDVRTTTTLIRTLDSERINQYEYCRRIPRGVGSAHIDVSICKDTTADDRKVLVKAVKRKMHEDKYRQLRRTYQLNQNLYNGEQSIRKEIAVLKSCRHANIIQLLEVVDDPKQDRVWLVLEYMAGGEVQWRNDRNEPILTVEQSRRILRDVAVGLEYLHQLNIVHRDIKPANLVWSEDHSIVKIIDYGISHCFGDTRPFTGEKSPCNLESSLFTSEELTKQRGTGYFMAPEVAWTSPSSMDNLGSSSTLQPDVSPIPSMRPPITKQIDVWSLGVTLYCFLFGQFPFQASFDGNDNQYHTRYKLFRQICTQDWTIPDSMGADGLPTGGKSAKDRAGVVFLLDCMLQKDPQLRITSDGVKRHPWVLRDIMNPSEWICDTSPSDCPGADTSASRWIQQIGLRILESICTRSFWCR